MARPLDPKIDEALARATLALLQEEGFARMSMERVAAAAGVGKPAIYRRFRDKAELVAAVIGRELPPLELPDLGDTRAELWQVVEHVFASEVGVRFRGIDGGGPAYVGLVGGLIAEEKRHPELIAAFRRTVLLPRRARTRTLIERGQQRGEIRADIDAEAALDLFAGPFLARVFAGEDTGPKWRRRAFDTWWTLIKGRNDQ